MPIKTSTPEGSELVDVLSDLSSCFRGYSAEQDMDVSNPGANVVDGLFEIANALYTVARAIEKTRR